MATASQYGSLIGVMSAAGINYASVTVKASLHTSSYTPNRDVDDFFNDATNQVTGTNYTAGGVTVTGKSVTYDSATDQTRWIADDLTWTNVTITGIRYLVYYVDTAGASTTDNLISYVNFGGDQTVSGVNFVVDNPTTGFVVFSTSPEA